MTRAAIFASAAACYTGDPAPQHPSGPPPGPPPPGDMQSGGEGTSFAKPPDGPRAVLRGRITLRTTGAGVPDIWVYAEPRFDGGRGQRTRSGPDGSFTFDDLGTGPYMIRIDYRESPRQPPPQRMVEVSSDKPAIVGFQVLPIPPPGAHPIDPSDAIGPPKPYGAPPARRRVV